MDLGVHDTYVVAHVHVIFFSLGATVASLSGNTSSFGLGRFKLSLHLPLRERLRNPRELQAYEALGRFYARPAKGIRHGKRPGSDFASAIDMTPYGFVSFHGLRVPQNILSFTCQCELLKATQLNTES